MYSHLRSLAVKHPRSVTVVEVPLSSLPTPTMYAVLVNPSREFFYTKHNIPTYKAIVQIKKELIVKTQNYSWITLLMYKFTVTPDVRTGFQLNVHV